jgi:hypothetical protein
MFKKKHAFFCTLRVSLWIVSSGLKVHTVYTLSTTVPVPSSELGTPQASVSPPEPKGRAHFPAGEGVGGSPNSDDWRKT